MNWHNYFTYDDGKIYWKVAPKRKPFLIGCEAGSGKDGWYRHVKINGIRTSCHRVVFEMFNGEIQDGMVVDHINGIKDDNRIDNLRVVSVSINAKNQKVNSKNNSGINGVRFYKRAGKWIAYSKSFGKYVHLGYFDSMESAIDARELYNSENGFTERHGKC